MLNERRFILVTDDEHYFDQQRDSIVSISELELDPPKGVCAAIIDYRIPEEKKRQAVELCISLNLPYFFWEAPLGLSADKQDLSRSSLMGFLNSGGQLPTRPVADLVPMNALVDIITTANSLLEPDEVMDSVMSQIQNMIACEAWSVLLLDKRMSHTLIFAAAAGPGKEKLVDIKLKVGQGIAGWVAEQGEPIIVNHVQSDPRFLHEVDKDTNFATRNILCAPLVSRGRSIGVIEMLNRIGADGFSPDDLKLVQILVNPAAVAIENAYLFQKAQTLTIQDDLTKLYNSRHLNYCLSVEFSRAKKGHKPLSLLFLDLDGFKAINDNYGHLQGSQSLVDIGQKIRAVVRSTDIIGRYGGDEFVVIMPNTDLDEALLLGEKLRASIETYHIKALSLSASIGIASYPDHGKSKEELIRLADMAMYWVKEHGKNGVVSADKVLDVDLGSFRTDLGAQI